MVRQYCFSYCNNQTGCYQVSWKVYTLVRLEAFVTRNEKLLSNRYKASVHIGKSWGLKYKKSVKVIQCSISAQAWLVCKMWKCFEVDRIKKKTNYISLNCRICFCWFVWDYKEMGVYCKIQILYTQTFYF